MKCLEQWLPDPSGSLYVSSLFLKCNPSAYTLLSGQSPSSVGPAHLPLGNSLLHILHSHEMSFCSSSKTSSWAFTHAVSSAWILPKVLSHPLPINHSPLRSKMIIFFGKLLSPTKFHLRALLLVPTVPLLPIHVLSPLYF